MLRLEQCGLTIRAHLRAARVAARACAPPMNTPTGRSNDHDLRADSDDRGADRQVQRAVRLRGRSVKQRIVR